MWPVFFVLSIFQRILVPKLTIGPFLTLCEEHEKIINILFLKTGFVFVGENFVQVVSTPKVQESLKAIKKI